ncbi:MAG: NAD(P)/FAD-dependent oxidoreductase [Pseudomonadota bacterium]
MDDGRRAIVVGAGITGLSAAEWLRRAGWRVTLIDRGEPGEAGAASFGNGGVLARSAVVPVPTPGLWAKIPRMLLDPDGPLFLRWSYLPRAAPFLASFLRHGREAEVRRIAGALAGLLDDCVDQHRALAAGTGAEAFLRAGEYGFLHRDRAGWEADGFARALKAAHGYEAREIGRAEIEARFPGLAPGFRFGAIYPDHGWIEDPGGYLRALAGHFAREGGTVRRGEVAAISGEGKVTLRGGAVMRAERVVLAAGARSRALAEGLGLRLPLETERGYHLHLPDAPKPAHPWMVADAKAVATPMRGGVRLAGVTEIGGLAAGPSKGPERLLRRAAARLWSGAAGEGEVWMGHRPVLPDSLPALGAVPGAERVVLATGAQHVGLTLGPRLGRMAAEIAAGGGSNLDLAPFAPGRFGRG